MGFLTDREKEIMQMLKDGDSVREIGKHFNVSDASIAKSINSIRAKTLDLEADVEFLTKIGFMEIKDGELIFLSKGRDPKDLAKLS